MFYDHLLEAVLVTVRLAQKSAFKKRGKLES
jgi:hypothetical protein